MKKAKRACAFQWWCEVFIFVQIIFTKQKHFIKILSAFYKKFCYTSPMTIKRRLFISNIVMILVPAAVAALIALGAAFAFWRVVYVQYMDESLEDRRLPLVYKMISEQVESYLESGDAQGRAAVSLSDFAESHGIFIKMNKENGELLFSAGNETDDFRRIENKFSVLFETSSVLEDSSDSSSSIASDWIPDSTVNTENGAFSLNINGMFFVKEPLSVHSENYSLFIFGTFDWHEDKGNEAVFKTLLAGVVLLVFMAVFATNSFLTRFIVKKVQSPLEILEDGVKNISDGNLSYRINYSADDEFLPICSAFNSMAVRLAELSEAQKKDEKNRRELIAGISHDLRTPLTSIKAYVEGLWDGVADTDEKREKYMATILLKTNEIITMTERLFMFSKLDLDEYPFSTEKLNVAAEIKKIVQSFSDDYGEKLSIKTDFSYGENDCENGSETKIENAEIVFDKIQFRNALANIVENSLKYCGKEKCVVKISCGRRGGFAEISVLDNGPGVPDGALEKLFDVFYRTDSARSPRKKGSGLGLAITAKVCQHFGGTIFAENATEKDELPGLKITIRLPLA